MKHFAVLPLLLISTTAFAQATPQGAADLTAVFQTYLGKTPGVVSVTAEGDAYAVTLDAGPFIDMIPAEVAMTVSATPLQFRLTENGDGTWGVTQDQQLRISTSAEGVMDMTITADRIVCTGVFDTSIKAFVRNACEVTALGIDQVINDPINGRQVTSQLTERIVTSSSATAGAAGGVDSTLSYADTNTRSVIEGPFMPGGPVVKLDVAIAEAEYNGTTTGVRNAELLAALAWVVANPDPAAMDAKRGEIKAILTAALPIFEEVDIAGSINGLSVESPVGPFRAATMGFGGTIRGALDDGLYRVAMDFAGLSVPDGLLPPWSTDLTPQTLSLDIGVGGYDGAAAASMLLGLFDLPPGAEPGPEFEAAFMSALLPDGSVKLTLGSGEVTSPIYALTYQGSLTAGPMVAPTGSGTVTATGLDAVTAALDSAPQESKDQVLPLLGMARGLAKPGTDGALMWEIDASTPGNLIVNGMDLMGLQ